MTWRQGEAKIRALVAVIRPFDRLRRRRNEVEYPGESVPAVTGQEVADELHKAAAILELARKALDDVDAFA